MKMINVSIVGGTGYTAGELLRILLRHPQVNIESVISTTSVGKRIDSVHRDLLGETDLVYSKSFKSPDLIFLCLGHGLSRSFLENNQLPENCKIIDLGNDFRNQPQYGDKKFIFGLCEQFKDEIKDANYVANPGCFATTIMLALLPLASKKLLKGDIHVHAITGSTGAGKSPGETTHFSYRDSNLSVYKPFTHQHLEEIGNTLTSAGNSNLPQINFVPIRGDFTRGIFASIYTKWEDTLTKEEVISFFKSYYQNCPFVFVSDEPISLKEVVNTNKCLLHIEFHNGYIHITSITDNLVKGASGQAVQNMNLMYGLEETTGLKLKGSSF
ncbi:MAG TPA: N-acetyl-gamma-glutamyl-phosphate reductase [Fermentimonas sp.]|nr:N-acetyl-gamma-glutamyl-phosphate reductase [Fermentimonas sp.]